MYVLLIPLLLGFALVGASAFTAAYFQRWGELGGQLATSILRNVPGIPLWSLGFILAWRAPAPFLLGSEALKILGWLLLAIGSVPVIWGHLPLGRRAHTPSVHDTRYATGYTPTSAIRSTVACSWSLAGWHCCDQR